MFDRNKRKLIIMLLYVIMSKHHSDGNHPSSEEEKSKRNFEVSMEMTEKTFRIKASKNFSGPRSGDHKEKVRNHFSGPRSGDHKEEVRNHFSGPTIRRKSGNISQAPGVGTIVRNRTVEKIRVKR